MPTGEWDQIADHDGPRFPLVIELLERGEAPGDVARLTALDSLNLVLAVAFDGLGSSDFGPNLVQEKPRRPRLRDALTETGLPALFPHADRPRRLALAAGLLQIHDFWEESHRAAQEADDLGEADVSAYWHAIAHRREPDPGNASYWFRRVARHPVLTPLAEAARLILETNDVDRGVIARLLPQGMWHPAAFIEVCSHERTLETIARQIQREEMRLLLMASIPS